MHGNMNVKLLINTLLIVRPLRIKVSFHILTAVVGSHVVFSVSAY